MQFDKQYQFLYSFASFVEIIEQRTRFPYGSLTATGPSSKHLPLFHSTLKVVELMNVVRLFTLIINTDLVHLYFYSLE